MDVRDLTPEFPARHLDVIRQRAGDAVDGELLEEFLAGVAAELEDYSSESDAAALADPAEVDGALRGIVEERVAERERIEGPLKLLVCALRTPAPDEQLRACADAVVQGLRPTDRAALLLELPQREREILERAYPALFEEVERQALAAHLDAIADIHQELASRRTEQGQPMPEAREMVAARRRVARAIRAKDDYSVEMRDLRRTTRKGLNRARGRLGLHPLPVPRPLRLSACRGARHRRAPGRKPIRRPGSRRTPAPTRGDPDDGDPEPPAPAPGARRQHRGGTSDQVAAHRRHPNEGVAA